jgi:hypothetical protein
VFQHAHSTEYFYCNQPLEGLLQSRNEQVLDCFAHYQWLFLSFAFVSEEIRNGVFLMNFNNSEYELIDEQLICNTKDMCNLAILARCRFFFK